MRVAGRLAAQCLDMITDYIKPGSQQIRLIRFAMSILKIMVDTQLLCAIEVLKNLYVHL